MDMYELLGKQSPQTIAKNIAIRFKQCRKNKKMTQIELAKKTLVPVSTIRYFEQTGKVNLLTLLFLCERLDLLDDFANILIPDNHLSYKDLTHGN